MTPKILLRESLAEKSEIQAAARYFPVIDSRVKISSSDFIIPRYSVWPFAREFYDDLRYLGAQSINTYQQFSYISSLKNHIHDLGDLTFPTWPAAAGTYNLPDNCSFTVKGETNSRKFHWNTMMFAPTKADLGPIISRLLSDSQISDQELFIRKYIPLKNFGTSFNGLPITQEYRFFIYQRQIMGSGFYWSANFSDLVDTGHNVDVNLVPQSFLQRVIDRISPHASAYVIDVGQTDSGDWIVIELNAFEQSGLSEVSAESLYSNLSRLLK